MEGKKTMTNKNLKDEEIIKALECCSLPFNECAGCPLYDDYPSCEIHVIDLINRQKAEIERLRSMNQAKLDAIHDLRAQNEILSKNADNAFQEGLNECRELFEPEIKAEAYKEFVERVKEASYKLVMCNNGIPISTSYQISLEELNKILNEMEGENK